MLKLGANNLNAAFMDSTNDSLITNMKWLQAIINYVDLN